MKIGLMIRNLGERGGINVYTVNLIEKILKLDKSNEYVFIYNDKSLVGKYSKFKNVKEIAVESRFKLYWDQVVIPKIIKKEKIEVIFNPKLSIPLFTKAHKVLMIHGAEQFAVKSAFKWYDRIYVQIMMPIYARVADVVLTTTKTGIDDLAGYLKIPKDKFVFAYEGVHERFKVLNSNLLNEVKQKYNLPDKFILFIGGLTPLKNFGRVVKAFDIVSQKFDYKLVVVGFKRFKFENELKIAEGLKEKNKIVFPGFVPDEDLPAFYNLADLLVFPSLYEGFGLPVLEAMACGCPIVTTKTGCTKEVTGKAALLANPYDVKEIAEKMEEIRKNPEAMVKTVKDMWNNIKPRIIVTITGENINIASDIQKLQIAAQMEPDPLRRSALVEKIVNKLGIDTSTLPKALVTFFKEPSASFAYSLKSFLPSPVVLETASPATSNSL